MSRGTEQMLSDMADARERDEAAKQGMTVAALKAKRRACRHVWVTDATGLIDICDECGEGQA